MVCDALPFDSDEQICNSTVVFPIKLTIDCEDIIRKCLKKQPNDRPSLEDLMNHPWMTLKLGRRLWQV